MLTRIVEFSLRFNGVVIALACVVVVYGIFVTLNAKLDVFPEFAPPQVVIQTEAPGFSSEQVEKLVTSRIEAALMGTAGIESIRSQSMQGLSVVTAVFRENTDIYRARQMVGESLPQVASQMPQGVRPPTMAPLASATSMILSIGLTSERLALMDLRTFADWTVKPRLLAVPGVAKVSTYGGGQRELQIQVFPDRLLAYGIGIDQVLEAGRRATGIRGAGFVENRNQRIVLETRGQSIEPAELGLTVLSQLDGVSVRLRDVAQVAWAPQPQISDAAILGHRGVIITVSSQYLANTLEVTARVEQALAELAPSFKAAAIGVNPRLFRAATFIRTAVDNVRYSLIIGGLLVTAVLFMFLYNVRTSLISLTAIPLSLLVAVIGLDQMGMTLNTLTLGGLAIALGETVDDAIIDVENVLRRLRRNRTREAQRPVFNVILDASLEVRSAVVYATFVVTMVFAPVLAMSGLQGRIFAPLGWAYILAIMASLAVALTVTPALALVLLPKTRPTPDTALVRALKSMHARWLRATADRPGFLIAIVAVMCAGAASTIPFFRGSFLPELQEGTFTIHMVGIPGTSIPESLRMGGIISRLLLANPHVASVSQRVGRAEQGDDILGPQQSEFEVGLKPLDGVDSEDVQAEVRRGLAAFPGYYFGVNSLLTERIGEIISGEKSDVVIKLFGDDLDRLDRAAGQIVNVIARIAGATDVQVVSPGGMPELVVSLRPERLVQFGLRPVDVLDALQTAYQGSKVTQTYEGIRVFNVSVILDPASRREPESVGSLMLRGPQGKFVALRELASIAIDQGRYSVLHDGGRRLQIVTLNVRGRDLDSLVAEARRKIHAEVALPAGSYLEFTGAAQARSQAEHEILISSSAAAVAIIALLYIAFGNLRNLMLVLVNVPFALVGGVVAALLTGGWLSLGSIVGFVTLFGITTRNSIMMISHFEHLVTAEGEPWGLETVLRGASERLVPILMTALVTGLGLLPLAIGSGAPGREVEGPMAIIILGGLVTSTVLNLLVLPALALSYGRFGDRLEAPPA